MKVSFQLTMPNVGSWDGKWTGASKKYYVIRVFRGKEGSAFLKGPMQSENKKGFYYNFGDGWSANVCAEIVDAVEARKREKQSAGFCGYEWMINSIVKHSKIISADTKVPE
jgi:hypothetical protein